MSEKLKDAIIRAFIRYGVAPPPRDLETRWLRYQRELGELVGRRELKQGMAGALRDGEYHAEAKKLGAAWESEAQAILENPHSYRFWHPSPEDWKELALRQMLQHEPDLAPAEEEPEGDLEDKRISAKGDRLWYRQIYADKALEEIAAEKGIRPDEVMAKEAAERTYSLIKIAERKGLWHFRIPSKSTIIAHWNKMDFRWLEKDHDPWVHRRRPPSFIRQAHARTAHFEAIWHSAELIGRANWTVPIFSDFAEWVFERLSPERRLPPQTASWADFEQHMQDSPEEDQAIYQELLNEFSGEDIKRPRRIIANFGAPPAPEFSYFMDWITMYHPGYRLPDEVNSWPAMKNHLDACSDGGRADHQFLLAECFGEDDCAPWNCMANST